MSTGFADKLFWRQVGLKWHCFKRLSRQKGEKPCWGSLCCRHELSRSGGQECRRPPAHLRCGLCDGAEMERRGWDESGPESENRQA
jgi:hypothetical protein